MTGEGIERAGAAAPVAFPDLTGLRVLVVDDDPDTRVLLAFVLLECGAVVSEAASGRAALAALQATPFDLLISDIELPEMDGFELLHQVRAVAVAANALMPALDITGFADEPTRLKLLAAGFQRLLVKPTDLEHFVALVAELANRQPVA